MSGTRERRFRRHELPTGERIASLDSPIVSLREATAKAIKSIKAAVRQRAKKDEPLDI